jgi:hypothetical protein
VFHRAFEKAAYACATNVGCVGGLCLSGLVLAQPQQESRDEGMDYPLVRYSAQLGVDAWQFSNGRPDPLLMMSTNAQWHYRPVSPWGTLDGRLMVSSNATLALKARSNQEMGSHLDELSADWAISPRLGMKVGVVDYKTSWCRTYDVDSPWVRENDPFCTVVEVSGPSGGAPGAQLYTNMQMGLYRVQAIAGVYSPLWFGYNKTEFSNLTYARSRVEKNNKQGFSINALNLDTAMEFRFGYLATQQTQAVHSDWNAPDFHVEQVYDITFAGVSFYAAPKLNVRMQTLRHVMSNKNVMDPGAIYPHTFRGNALARRSYVMELHYQQDVQNVFALAVSKFGMHNTLIQTNYPYSGYTVYPEFSDYAQRSFSLAWRHDWPSGVFTAVQLTRSSLVDTSSYYGYDKAMHANGLGMRLGYRF